MLCDLHDIEYVDDADQDDQNDQKSAHGGNYKFTTQFFDHR